MEGKLFCDSLLIHNNNINEKSSTVFHIKQINQRKSILDHEKSIGVKNIIDSLKSEILDQFASKTVFPSGITPRTDDGFLLKFLRVKKYSMESTVKRITSYYHHVHRNLRVIEGIRVYDYTKVYENQVVSCLKSRMPIDNSIIIYLRLSKWNTKQISFRDLQLATLFLLEELMRDNEVNQVNGVSVVADLDGMGFSHLRELTVGEIKNILQILMGGLPVRMCGIYAINIPRIIWPIYAVVNKILPEKMRSRIHFYKGYSCFHQVISPDYLPESLGGYLDEEEGLDETTITNLTRINPVFDTYWSGELNHRPRRLSRKRSSLVLGL